MRESYFRIPERRHSNCWFSRPPREQKQRKILRMAGEEQVGNLTGEEPARLLPTVHKLIYCDIESKPLMQYGMIHKYRNEMGILSVN